MQRWTATGKPLCEHSCLMPRVLPAPLISLASAFLLSLSLPFPKFCSFTESEIARPIPITWAGEGIRHKAGVSPVGGQLTLLGLAVYFVSVHSTCWLVLDQGPSQAKPSRVALVT